MKKNYKNAKIWLVSVLKRISPYKTRWVVFLYLIQNLRYLTYFAQHSYLCYEYIFLNKDNSLEIDDFYRNYEHRFGDKAVNVKIYKIIDGKKVIVNE